MITIEFGAAENQNLDANSMFIKINGYDFQKCLDKIKNYWNRTYLKNSREWEVPFSCYEEILQLFKDTKITYLNNPPKARKVNADQVLNGIDFNGYTPYDYQLDGIKYGIEHQNFLLLDEQGLRKNNASFKNS